MNERIHRYLDGEINRSALSESERREANVLRSAIRSALAPLREEPAPDVTGAVMAAVQASDPIASAPAGSPPESPFVAALAALWRPRRVAFRLRPVWGLAAAAVVALAFGMQADPRNDPSPILAGGTVMAGDPVEGRVFVVFRLDAPGAASVLLAGDFTDWRAGPALRQESPGVWTAVVPLTPGLHDYAFLVDGDRWVADPMGERVDDGFGGSNSRVVVLTGARLDEA